MDANQGPIRWVVIVEEEDGCVDQGSRDGVSFIYHSFPLQADSDWPVWTGQFAPGLHNGHKGSIGHVAIRYKNGIPVRKTSNDAKSTGSSSTRLGPEFA
jgi:hypothetical protein